MDEGAGPRGRRLVPDAEVDAPGDDIERFVPRMGVWWRPSAFRPALVEDLVASGGLTRGQHGDGLAHDLQRGCLVGRLDDEGSGGHGSVLGGWRGTVLRGAWVAHPPTAHSLRAEAPDARRVLV